MIFYCCDWMHLFLYLLFVLYFVNVGVTHLLRKASVHKKRTSSTLDLNSNTWKESYFGKDVCRPKKADILLINFFRFEGDQNQIRDICSLFSLVAKFKPISVFQVSSFSLHFIL